MPARDYQNTRFSPLDQINASNVGTLKLAWTFSTGVLRGHEAAPIVADNTLYIVTPYPNLVYALDLAQPGAPVKWKFSPNPVSSSQGVACCDLVNRGAIWSNGRLFFNTLDNQTFALDAHTGTKLWQARLGDIRIASEKASFGQPEINLGIIPGGGGTQRLTRLVGEGKAMEMILTGEIIDAQTAFTIGLVNHVVAADQLETKTMEIANRIADKSPIALRLAKEAVKIASRSNLDEGLKREVDLFALCFSSEDKDEGVKAFLEKRKPEFKGK